MKVVEEIKNKPSRKKSWTLSTKVFYRMALIYLTLPLLLFFIGYLRIYWAAFFTLAVGAACALSMRSFERNTDGSIPDIQERSIEIKPSYIIVLLLLIPPLLYWAGVSEFGNCTEDHRVRYAILNDLVEYKWPVVYDFATQQNPQVAAALGSGKAAFAYYFVFWMVPSLIGKLFGLMAARIALLIWSGLGLFLIATGASLLYKRASRLLFLLLILFAGFDVIPYAINRLTGHATTWECWTKHLFIHGNYYQLMNVFNQSIPGWLITILLMLNVNSRSIGLLGGLMFCYSPWATIGILPLCICKFIVANRTPKTTTHSTFARNLLRNLFTVENLALPIISLVLFGSLYTANPNATGADGFIWKFYDSPWVFFRDYLLYAFFEFGLWFILVIRKNKKDPMLWTAFATLLVLPIYKISIANDFLMRGSMAPMFLISLYAVMYVNKNFEKCRSNDLPFAEAFVGRAALALALIAAYTPINHIFSNALISYQMHFTDIVNYEDEVHKIGSFGNIINEDELTTVQAQFYVYDYEDAIFFKYFAK